MGFEACEEHVGQQQRQEGPWREGLFGPSIFSLTRAFWGPLHFLFCVRVPDDFLHECGMGWWGWRGGPGRREQSWRRAGSSMSLEAQGIWSRQAPHLSLARVSPPLRNLPCPLPPPPCRLPPPPWHWVPSMPHVFHDTRYLTGLRTWLLACLTSGPLLPTPRSLKASTVPHLCGPQHLARGLVPADTR